MHRILFVDDEPNILEGLRRMLRPLRNEWDIYYAHTGEDALRIMDESPFDVVVSDMRMPGMNGADLLCAVRDRHPQIARLILSGQSDRELTLRLVHSSHQFVSKPCDSGVLKDAVTRACSMRDTVSDGVLKTKVAQLNALAALPSVARELADCVQSPAPSSHELGRIIAKDVGMTAKILQLVNSSFFGVGRPICDAEQAAVMLGVETIKMLSTTVHVFDAAADLHDELEAVRVHSALASRIARRIAEFEGHSQPKIEEISVAAFLHDVGKLALAQFDPALYSEAARQSRMFPAQSEEAEHEIFGNDHANVGGYLLGLWGLPPPVVEAVAGHQGREPSVFENRQHVAIVYAADQIAHELDACRYASSMSGLKSNAIERYGAEILARWRPLFAQELNGR